MNVLVLNGGSSSVKATVFAIEGELASTPAPALWEGEADWGRRSGAATIKAKGEATKTVSIQTPAEVIEPLLASAGEMAAIDLVGHRVVHGGPKLQETVGITPEVKAELARCAEFAPEHNRLELSVMEAAEKMLGSAVPQVAVFDTSFHRTLDLAAKVYPIPYEWYEKGIRRYGFHGISHQYVSRRAAEILGGTRLRLITCHLGNGASLAAVRNGKSIDTTMGLTPLEGLMMGTRSGSIDPGILIYLARHAGFGGDQLDEMLNRESGLKGISGISGDMREILTAMDQKNPRAQLAFDIYAHRLCREIGGMAASLGGVDALVFTAGIGENCAPLRAAVCSQLRFLGIEIDAAKNERGQADADTACDGSAVRVLIIHTEEDWEIARACVGLSRKM